MNITDLRTKSAEAATVSTPLKFNSLLWGARSPINTLCMACASYFRLLRPLRALSVNKLGGLGACSPWKNFKVRRSEIASEALFGPKKLLEFSHL